MKLAYVVFANIPDDWAHSVQIMNMCRAFSEVGAKTTLFVPHRRLAIVKNNDPFKFYGIDPTFEIKKIPCIDLCPSHPHPIFYWIRLISFYVSVRVHLLFRSFDVIYSRDIHTPLLFRNVFLERHSFSKDISRYGKIVFHLTKGLVVLTSFIKERMVQLGISENKIFVSPDAVRMEDFAEPYEVAVARKKVSLPNDRKYMGYVGTLKTMNEEKGVATAIESLNHLPQDVSLYVIGGEKDHVEYYRTMAREKGLVDRVVFQGKVPHADVPLYISACDCLVAPFPNIEHYAYFMSPLKIFEYMASRRPMIVSDLPSLREVLVNNEDSLFVEPANAKDLADKVSLLLSDKNLSRKISEGAYQKVITKYTWKKRAQNILDFISQTIKV